METISQQPSHKQLNKPTWQMQNKINGYEVRPPTKGLCFAVDAHALGKANADYVLEKSMAKNPETANKLLNDYPRKTINQ